MVDPQLIKLVNLEDALFKKNINIFYRLKLEIALAIPSSNDKKYNRNNSARQALLTCYILVERDDYI